MKKCILVTGASGFIGTALCRYLVSLKGVSVIGAGYLKSEHSFCKEYFQLDLSDKDRFKKFLVRRKPTVIFHLAGGRVNDPSKMVTANILTTVNVFEVIRSIPQYHPRVIIIGSAAEYGDRPSQSRPIIEQSLTHPVGLYGWIKLAQTQTALHYARLGEDVVIARLFNIIGPGISDDMAVGKFARKIVALEKKPSLESFTVADLRGVRDFLDIRDICEALYILSSKGKRGELYNICSQKGIVMRDLLGTMIKASSYDKIKFKEDKQKDPGILYSVGSCLKLKRTTGWQPKYNLQRSVQDTLDYYRRMV